MGAERMEQTSATFLAVHPDIRDCDFKGVQDAKPFKLDRPVRQELQTLDIIAIPGANDTMLNYKSTSFHDQLYINELLCDKRAPEFARWLEDMEIADQDGRLRSLRSDLPLKHRLPRLTA